MASKIILIVLSLAFGISSLASAETQSSGLDLQNTNRLYILTCEGDLYSRLLVLESEYTDLGQKLTVWYSESSNQNDPIRSAIREFPSVLIYDGLEQVREGQVDGPAPGKNKVVIDKRFDSHSISLTEIHILNGSKRFQRSIALKFTDQELTRGKLTKVYYWPGQNVTINCQFKEYR